MDSSDKQSWAVSLRDRIKDHPIVVIVGGLMVLLGWVVLVVPLVSAAWHSIQDKAHPFDAQYRMLQVLDIGQSARFVQRNLGIPEKSVTLCQHQDCPAGIASARPVMNLYRLPAFEVRGIFIDRQLQWYAVTVTDPKFEPSMTWLGWDLGKLGEATFARVLPGGQGRRPMPTDAELFSGPSSAAYVEVFAGGAPADYEGILIALSPESRVGTFGSPAASDPSSGAQGLGSKAFRSASVPNTFGRFRDDGPLTTLAEDATETRTLLYQLSDDN